MCDIAISGARNFQSQLHKWICQQWCKLKSRWFLLVWGLDENVICIWLFLWSTHKTKDSVLVRKAGLFRWVASPKKVPKEGAKSRGALATRAQLRSLLCLALWALSSCNCSQIGIKGNLQVLDAQYSNYFWSMAFVGVSLKSGSQTQHIEGKRWKVKDNSCCYVIH